MKHVFEVTFKIYNNVVSTPILCGTEELAKEIQKRYPEHKMKILKVPIFDTLTELENYKR